MKTYLVRWEIDIEADSFKEAAEQALLIQRDPSSIATVFDVLHGRRLKTVDLGEASQCPSTSA